jgi:hypothetical protein
MPDTHFLDSQCGMLPICINVKQISAMADLLAHGAPGVLR